MQEIIGADIFQIRCCLKPQEHWWKCSRPHPKETACPDPLSPLGFERACHYIPPPLETTTPNPLSLFSSPGNLSPPVVSAFGVDGSERKLIFFHIKGKCASPPPPKYLGIAIQGSRNASRMEETSKRKEGVKITQQLDKQTFCFESKDGMWGSGDPSRSD